MRRALRLSPLLAALAAATPAGVEAKTLAVRTPHTDPAIAEAIRGGWFVSRLARRLEGFEVVVGPAATGDVVVVAAGLPAPPEVHRLVSRLPVELEGETIVFDGTRYEGDREALALGLPGDGPIRWVVVGRRPAVVSRLVSGALASSAGVALSGTMRGFDYWLYHSPYLSRQGRWRPIGDAPAAALEIDRAAENDQIAARARSWASRAVLGGRHLALHVAPDRRRAPHLVALVERLDRAVAAMAERLPWSSEQPLRVFVEDDLETLGRYLGEVAEAALPALETGFAGGDLHLVFHPEDGDAFRFGVARAVLRRAGIELPPALADGAALWLSEGWYDRPYADYLPALAAAGALPTAAELTANERQPDASRVLWAPVAAAVVEAQPGRTLREKLAGGLGPGSLAAALRGLTALPPPDPPPRPALPRFLRGISFAMTPGLENGYHATGVDPQLARFNRLGADAVAVMPFAFQRRASEPPMTFVHGEPGEETDAGLIHAARRAQAHGFRVLWKPHLYIGGSWPGEIRMGSEASWRRWWASYRRYILHHAILARFAGADVLSIGVELGQTLDRGEEWRGLIDGTRLLYPGALTYAGNWWGDFDRAPFWDRLDLIGVDAYFPLASEAEADRATLLSGARQVVDRLAAAARRHAKPLILTEVGFAARRASWVAPHEEGGEHDEADQRLAYDALLTALGRPPWLGGVFFWKAFSHPRSDRGGPRPDFRFLDRPAEAVIRDYFQNDHQAEPERAEPTPPRR